MVAPGPGCGAGGRPPGPGYLGRVGEDGLVGDGSIKATLGRPGRPTTDPQVLLALWLLGTVEGVGSARKLTRLCEEHDAYRWLCGGVPINYHMVSDFRVAHQGALDELLTQIVASLMAAGAVTLERVAQDGVRGPAPAPVLSAERKSWESTWRRRGLRSHGWPKSGNILTLE